MNARSRLFATASALMLFSGAALAQQQEGDADVTIIRPGEQEQQAQGQQRQQGQQAQQTQGQQGQQQAGGGQQQFQQV